MHDVECQCLDCGDVFLAARKGTRLPLRCPDCNHQRRLRQTRECVARKRELGEHWSDSRIGKLVELECPNCGTRFSVPPSRAARPGAVHCSRACSAASKATVVGEYSPNWKGGKPYKSKAGYVTVSTRYLPDDQRAIAEAMVGARRVFEHRLVMAIHLGRPLEPWEHVHHKNGVKDDNRVDNLEVVANGTHRLTHAEVLSELKALRLENASLRRQLASV